MHTGGRCIHSYVGVKFLATDLIQGLILIACTINEPRCEKTDPRGFLPGLIQTGLCSHRRRLEA